MFTALFRRTRVLSRAAANADRFYGGPPFGREAFTAPKLYDPKRDLDGVESAARLRAQAITMRKFGCKNA